MKEEISENEIRNALLEQINSKSEEKIKRKATETESSKSNGKLDKHKKKIPKQSSDSDITKSDSNPVPNRTENQKHSTKRTKRPPPKIIVFNEPGKSHDKTTSNKRPAKRPKMEGASSDEDETDFVSVARDVKEFGMTGFSKKERRKYEQQKAQSLGAKAPKGLKMPYKILMSVNKVKIQREKKKEALDRAMGMATKKKSSKTEKTDNPAKASGWWTDNSSKGFDMALGKYKKGVQKISKDDIKRVQGSKR